MEKEKIQEALAANDFDAMLEVYNAYKSDEKFKNVYLKQSAYFNGGKEAGIKHSMLNKTVSNMFRILEQTNSFTRVVKKTDEPIGVKKLQLPPPPEPKGVVKQKPKVVKNPVVDYKELPADLQKLFDEAGKLKTESKSLHAMMEAIKGKDVNSNKKRKKLLNQLTANEEKFKENFEIIDKWWKENKVEK